MTKLINHIAHMRMPVACMFSAVKNCWNVQAFLFLRF